ncbi:MAG: DUF4194 domain-containing protein [Propionibacteriaceae bacterium]
MFTEVDDEYFDPLAPEVFDDDSSFVVFEGDEGRLRVEERRCLVYLLKKHVLSSERNPKEWTALVNSQALIKSRLNDLFLDLVIDHDRGVAYKVQVRHHVPGTFPPLLHDASYSREETVLLVFLRQRYASERAAGQERVFVDREECVDAVTGFRPANATDVTGDRSRSSNAVENLRSSGVLVKSGQEDRFEVSPVIEVLLPVGQLRSLMGWFIEQNNPESVVADDDEDDTIEEQRDE